MRRQRGPAIARRVVVVLHRKALDLGLKPLPRLQPGIRPRDALRAIFVAVSARNSLSSAMVRLGSRLMMLSGIVLRAQETVPVISLADVARTLVFAASRLISTPFSISLSLLAIGRGGRSFGRPRGWAHRFRLAFRTTPEIARRFPDLHPAFNSQEALIEANRCLNCFDAPCAAACPTHIDVPRFIKKIATRKPDGLRAGPFWTRTFWVPVVRGSARWKCCAKAPV